MNRLIIFLVLFSLVSSPVSAQTISSEKRGELLQQLQSLLTQVTTLQHQLARLHAAAGVITRSQDELYPTEFYKGKYEAAYSVHNATLSAEITAGIRVGDQALFNTFVAMVGKPFVEEHLSEFRVFNEEDNQLGAYVQQKMDGSWILAMNRFGKDLRTSHDSSGMIELLLHEYAHIVFFEETNIAQSFTDTFWESELMRQHSADTGSITDVNHRFTANSDFYETYASMFVTEYAASSPEEDLVESFVAFVTSDIPGGGSVSDQKILFFYQIDEMRTLRTQLRQSSILNVR